MRLPLRKSASGKVLPVTLASMGNYRHNRVPGPSYFLTVRLADPLPRPGARVSLEHYFFRKLAMMFKSALYCTLLGAASGVLAAAPDPTSKLGWLQGCWAATGAEAGSVEQWSSAAGGTMLGMSRTVRGGKTVAFEFVQIREVEPGILAYIAQPSGQPQATFKLLRHSETEFVFENLAHDFPQRVIYRREGEKALRARIEGMRKGALKGIDFPMQRTSCESA